MPGVPKDPHALSRESQRRRVFRVAGLALALTAACAGSAAATTDLLGTELALNVTTAAAQTTPAVAMTRAGDFVVAWTSAGQDGSGRGIFARRFDRAGQPTSGEIAVTITTALDQETPAVAIDAAGSFVVAWTSTGQDGSGAGVYLRRFRADGAALGGEIRVAETTAGEQNRPRLAWLADGSFVVAWNAEQSSAGDFDVFWRRFSAAGAALAGEQRANTWRAGVQAQPAVAALAGGAFVVAWVSESQDGSGTGVYLQRFAKGGARVGVEARAAADPAGDQGTPAVAAGDDGGFTIAFQGERPRGGVPGEVSQEMVFTRRFDGQGSAASPEVPVDATSTEDFSTPAIAASPDGGTAIVWRQADATTANVGDVLGELLGRDGAPLGPPLRINTYTAEDQGAPAAAADGAGRYVAVWQSFGQDGSSYGIFGQRLGRPLAECTPGASALCLGLGRFRVEAAWKTGDGRTGTGQARSLTDDTGAFWFFSADNYEVVLKVLAGCPINQRFWVYAAGLTDVDVVLIVTDTATGAQRVYWNPRGTVFPPIQDTVAFATCSATAAADPPEAVLTPSPAAFAGACPAGPSTLCLQNGRFSVGATWRTRDGASGAGRAVQLGADSGYFWFFGEANVELLVKVLAGCPVNDRFWVYAGGLTDVEVVLTVRDEQAGAVWARTNPLGAPFQPIQDSAAFATCP